MRTLLLLTLLGLAACDGAGLPGAASVDAGAACQVLASPTGVAQPGVYSPPPGIDCASIKLILQDGTPMDRGTFSIQCSSSMGSSFVSVTPHFGNPTEMTFEACE